MSDIIKVHDLPAMARYATAIQQFSNNVESAASQTERQFNEKVGGDKGEAISAFFEYLNKLQTNVFHQYPETLSKFSTVITVFEDSVTGGGFQKKAWTSASGCQSVRDKLNPEGGEQYQEIVDMIKSLQALLDDATNKLGSEQESLASIQSTAQSDLTSASQRRQSLHDLIQGAHDSLNAELGDVSASLSSLNVQIQEAKARIALPASSVLQGIRNGTLTKSKLEQSLRLIKSEADARALGAVWSDNPKDLIKEDANKISDDVHSLIAQEMIDWLKEEDKNGKLQYLIDAMGENGFEANAKFLLKFQSAAIDLGVNLQILADGLYHQDPEGNKGDIHKLEKQLDAIDKFIGLVESLYIIKLGRVTSLNEKSDGLQYTTREKIAVQLDFSGGNHEVFIYATKTTQKQVPKDSHAFTKWIGDEVTTEEKIYTSSITGTSDGTATAEHSAAIADLKLAREKAFEEAAYNAAKVLLVSTMNVYAPGVAPILLALEGLSIAPARTISNLGYYFPKDQKEGTGGFGYQHAIGTAELSKIILDYYKKSTDIDAKIGSEKLKIINGYLNRGSMIMTEESKYGESRFTQLNTQRHDFRAFLRLQEMDRYGAIRFVEEARAGTNKDTGEFEITSDISLEKSAKEILQEHFKDIQAQSKTKPGIKPVSKEIQAYLLGETLPNQPKLTLSNMTTEQVQELDNVLESLPVETKNGNSSKGNEAYKQYLSNMYEH